MMHSMLLFADICTCVVCDWKCEQQPFFNDVFHVWSDFHTVSDNLSCGCKYECGLIIRLSEYQ